ncbi:MAG: protein kinase [Byssovorax sp.]
MHPGDLVADRFVIERRAGAGGMGAVYLCRDRFTGEPVALKVLRDVERGAIDRFTREAEVLSRLRHPAVVRYVAHGVMGEVGKVGESRAAPYLAMEWLEGEDLGRRLGRQGLTLAESLAVARRAASALAEVHAAGVIHRDLKPSNLFLRDEDPEQTVLIDFGIARVHAPHASLTQTGIMLGTPGYMAPEQARGDRAVDARADVFALGCVLYKCITGQPAFPGEDLLAVLTKIVLAEIVPASEIRPGTPADLDALVTRMLAKEPAARPANGAAVLAALDALAPVDPAPASLRAPVGPAPPQRLTQGELRLVTVLLLGAGAMDDEALTLAGPSPDPVPREVVAPFGGRIERLLDGTRIVLLEGAWAATDQAVRAARCALALRRALPARPIAFATGRVELGGSVPVGEVIDRAALLLAGASRLEGAGSPILLDALSAGLLDARFEIDASGDALCLRREREAPDGARRLLGKLTSCVGRERELAALEQLHDECASIPAARAALLVGEAGAGKSRLRHELVERLRARDHRAPCWIARGDPLRAGVPFGMLAQLLKQALGLPEEEPLPARRASIRRWADRALGPDRAARTAEFLGELLGAPFSDDESVELRAARRSPELLADQMRRAWISVLDAESRSRPVILVLEDLHWGDTPTVTYVDAALRLLRHRPLLVLCFARPEVHDVFPDLLGGRSLVELPLAGLPRSASDRLARQALGVAVPEALLQALWERSAGNPFFLEELLRAVSWSDGVPSLGETPGTVLAMVESRMAALGPEARRILRAGSVFGHVFSRAGVEALLGGPTGVPGLSAELDRLERAEWITERLGPGLGAERELTFSHALVREVAYGMLTPEDRALGHRLAGAFLESAGERDAASIAEHFDRGGDALRAAQWFERAAEQALAGNDLGAAIALADRAEARGAAGEALGRLHLVRASAHRWRGELGEAEESALAAMSLLPEDSRPWLTAVHDAVSAAAKLGHNDRLKSLGELLEARWSEERATGPQVATMAQTAAYLVLNGCALRAASLLARYEPVADRFAGDPEVALPVHTERATRAIFDGDLSGYRAELQRAMRCAEQTGNLRTTCGQRVNLGFLAIELGAAEEAVTLLETARAEAEQMGLAGVVPIARSNLGWALARLGRLDEARVELDAAIETFAIQGDPRLEGAARIYRAEVLRQRGEPALAEAEAREAAALLSSARPLLPFALATLALALLDRGRSTDALAAAREAATLLDALGRVDEGEGLVRLALALSLDATGDRDAARVAIAVAKTRLVQRAAAITGPDEKKSFLERIPEHQRTIALGHAWSIRDP